MKMGVVLELKSGRAVILDGSGGFQTVPACPEWRAGDVVPLLQKRRPAWRPLGLAACLALVLGAGSWAWFAPAALVSLDVNPSAELTLNRFSRVVSARARNDEGAALLAAGDIAGMTADGAVAALLGSGYLGPYLDRENSVTLTVQSGDADLKARLLARVNETALSAVEAGTAVSCHGVDGDLVTEAHEHGVTAGKYLALLALQQADPSIDIEEYAHCGIGEIEEQTALCHAENHASDGSGCHGAGHGHHD